MNIKEQKKQIKHLEKVHIHKVCQMRGTSYEAEREKYGFAYDKNSMIDVKLLNLKK
jgi:hypothetical protein